MHATGGQPAFAIEGRSATLASGGDGLTVNMIGHVAGGEEAINARHGPVFLQDVAILIAFREVGHESAVRHMADGDENTSNLQLRFGTGLEILQGYGAHFSLLIGQVSADGRIPYRFDFWIGECAFGHDLRSAQSITTVDQIHLASELGQETGFLTGGISAPDDTDRDIAVERTVTGRAGRQPSPNQLLFIGQSEMAWGRTRRHDHRSRIQKTILPDLHPKMPLRGLFDLLDDLIIHPRAEFHGLLLHLEHEVRAHNTFGKARKILDLGGGGELAADLGARDQQGIEVGTGSVNRSGESSATRPDDDDIFHAEPWPGPGHRQWPRAIPVESCQSWGMSRVLSLVFYLAIGPGALVLGDGKGAFEGKIVCGYQGWFRAEGDGSGLGWHHYASGGKFEPGHCQIEVWPDTRGLPPGDRFSTSFRHPDGSVAEVFSSVRPGTVETHFRWMKEHGIDGVMLQRFATTTRDPRHLPAMDQVLANVRASATSQGRAWALMYDLSGLRTGDAGVVIEDWNRLLREKRIDPKTDAGYLHHHGRPLVALWGLGFNDRDPMLDDWESLLRFFREAGTGGGYAIMVGVPYHWRTLDRDSIADARLHALIARADIISPWAVGRLATPEDAAARVKTVLEPDLAMARAMGKEYLPVVFPGFSWRNLQAARGVEAASDAIPRRGGKFLLAQGEAALAAGARGLYVAMFDELDEATAILPMRGDPPVGDTRFVSEPGEDPALYLRVTGELGRRLRTAAP